MENDALNFDFHKRLRWITLAVVALTALTQAMLMPVLTHLISNVDIAISFALLLVFAVWTAMVDYSRLSATRQIISLLFELALIACGSCFGVYKIFHFLFMCLVAKGALQLRLKPLIAIMTTTYFVQTACSAAKQAAYFQSLVHSAGVALPSRYPAVLAFETHLYFVFEMLVVAAMTRTMVSERRNRLRAEQLADDVENLIVKNERSRISRDIHDGLGHTLTSLNIQLDVAKTMFEKDQSVAREALNVAKDLASDSLADVRRSVHMIREVDGSPFNLSEALTGLAVRAKRNHDIKIDLKVDAPELPLFKAHNLFCIVQEALTNAQRHSHAKQIQIEFKKESDHLSVQIVDDGSGFNPVGDLQGLGLRSMNERAEGVGGTFQIESSPGAGTKVNVKMPL